MMEPKTHDVSSLPAAVLLSKRVQEMVLDGDEPQPLHLSRADAVKADISDRRALIPVIDFSLIASREPSTAEQELQRLRSALCSWGCFQARNHGIPESLLDEVRRVGKGFFQQTMEEKRKYAKGVTEFEGYGADPVPYEGQSLDWSDRLLLEVYPEDRRNYKFWPGKPTEFRQILEDYTQKIHQLTEITSKAIAKSLNLEEHCFVGQFGERSYLQARFNYYSRCRRPDLVLGLKPHADGTGYTIIMQDEVEGLQVLKDKQWFTVPTISDAVLVLMGDQMEIMTNAVFKAPVHRVLTDSERERLSVAVFYTPEPNKEIGPEEGLINEARPQIFKKVKDYSDVHWDYYQQGERALHVARV